MTNYRYQRFYIAASAVVIFIVGVFIGEYLAANLISGTGAIDLEAIKIGLLLTIIIVLLMIGSIVLEIKERLPTKKGGK